MRKALRFGSGRAGTIPAAASPWTYPHIHISTSTRISMATASNPRTAGRFIQRTFDHLLVRSPKRSSQGVPTRVQTKPQFVHVRDRIPLWNISRGDRVRVISGSRKGKIGTVDYVDRERNRVFLNELEF